MKPRRAASGESALLVALTVALTVALAVALSGPAVADHTDPREPLAPTDGNVVSGQTRGDGVWRHLANFPGMANPALTGGGTDLEFFGTGRSQRLFGSFGTLGQDEAGSVGQRILRLVTARGRVKPKWVADHGSAHCAPASPSVTGLQHDVQVGRHRGVTLLTDTTDATGRCHDPAGGGIEIIDASSVQRKKFEPREVHLVRFPGFSHTNTIDKRRPWIVYSSSSDFDGRPWIDVLNMRSCYGKKTSDLEQRRAKCAPKVYRINLQPEWTQQRDQTSGNLEPGSATCHDITYRSKRLYCAAINSTVILDVSKLVNKQGRVKGKPLPCRVVPGTGTTAKVTDCSGMGKDRQEKAFGWKLVGFTNHPGRDCVAGQDNRTCNSNNLVRSDEGVAVAHEADPSHDRRFMFVTDERGGGIIPPGASCAPGIENPFGNGGAHAYDISDPTNIKYATTPTGAKAVYISDAVVAAETFCDIHVIEHFPGEQRLIVAYYSQGLKIVDYYVDAQGRLQFEERSSFLLPNTNVWAAEHFKIRDNSDGTRTYFIATNDIHRGVDVVSWTGRPNPIGAASPPAKASMTNAGLAGGSAVVLALAGLYRRRRAVR